MSFMQLPKRLVPLAVSTAFVVTGLSAHAAPSESEVIATYADIALAAYQDSQITARTMARAIDALLSEPSEPNLSAARAAWRAARVPYQQTEVFRFGNPVVDDWEGKVNAWPLDEGLIDYVDASYGSQSDENPYYAAIIIANTKVKIGGKLLDASNITPALLGEKLHEIDGVESNVATGYHAIEFLLWGQDLNGTDAGAGNRPASDFDVDNCSNGNCGRRGAYLKAATELLITDLDEMIVAWGIDGAARKRLMADPKAGIQSIITGMGSLSYGELAGERMKLGLMLHDPEEEHDCFSDNTHWSHYYDVAGIRNVYNGHYRRADGSNIRGASLYDLVAAKDATAASALKARINTAISRFGALSDKAESSESYDQLIGEGNKAGNAIVLAAINALIDQTKAIEGVSSALGLNAAEFEGSDSLDNPSAVE